MLALTLDKDAQEPIYHQIKRHIMHLIETGILAPGDRLPASRDLAEQLGVARISVVAAYEELRDEGVITAAQGRGTFVTARDDLPEATHSASMLGAARSQNGPLRDLLRLAARPGVIDFSSGAPAEDFLPVHLIRDAINTVLTRDGASAVTYEIPEGYPPLREAIAAQLATQGIAASADEILITGGCQQALDLAVQALVSPGDVILTANPTYAGILDISQARGVTILGVPVDEQGMQITALEAMIAEHRPRLLYAAPTYHNPTGTVMPLARRRQLLDIAAHYRLPILEDGVYEALNYTGSPPPALRALDEAGLVLYASSFSKIFMPGMRIGYLVASGRLYQRIARVKRAADVCTPALNQRAMHSVMESGKLWEHLASVQKQCRQRRSAMLDALRHHLSEAKWNEPAGGLYVWVEFPHDGPTATELFLESVRAGAAFAMGPLFYTDGQGTYHVRLNIAAHPPDRIEEGVRRLASAWRSLAEGYEPLAPQRSAPLL
jgi:GntR family transcriptional regulator / MocR family aminotransferase